MLTCRESEDRRALEYGRVGIGRRETFGIGIQVHAGESNAVVYCLHSWDGSLSIEVDNDASGIVALSRSSKDNGLHVLIDLARGPCFVVLDKSAGNLRNATNS